MKIFISWSGTSSREVAVALSNWIPKVIQGVEPFVSAKDIDKGSSWTYELTKELQDTDFGIICLAPDNLLSPWLNYEAGAITKSVESRVAPVLFHVLKDEVQAPLSQLQLTEIELEEFELLMGSVSRAAGSSLSEERVKEAVSVWWSSLVRAIDEIDVPDKVVVNNATPVIPSEPEKPTADVAELLSDVLGHVRQFDRKLNRLEAAVRGSSDPRQRSSPSGLAVKFLESHIRKIGGEPKAISIEEDRVEIVFAETLPESEIPELIEIGRRAAKNESLEIWFFMPERTLTISPSGRVSEIPF